MRFANRAQGTVCKVAVDSGPRFSTSNSILSSGAKYTRRALGVEDRRAIAQPIRSTGTHVVAASTEDQLASEISQLEHGVFAYALLQDLNGKASNQDETVTVGELIAYIEQKLPSISEKYRQKSQYPVIDSRVRIFPWWLTE